MDREAVRISLTIGDSLGKDGRNDPQIGGRIPTFMNMYAILKVTSFLAGRVKFRRDNLSGLAESLNLTPSEVNIAIAWLIEYNFFEVSKDKEFYDVSSRLDTSSVNDELIKSSKLQEMELPIETSIAKLLLVTESNLVTADFIVSEFQFNNKELKFWLNALREIGLISYDKIDDDLIVLSPRGTYNSPDKLFSWLKMQSEFQLDDINSILGKLNSNVGLPLNYFNQNECNILFQLINSGWVTSVAINDKLSKKLFLFPPNPSLRDDSIEHDIFDKTRFLLASMRYGQYLAEKTKIRSPDAILRKLAQGLPLMPHSDAQIQYYHLGTRGLLTLDERIRTTMRGERYQGVSVRLVETEENLNALQRARELLSSDTELNLHNIEPRKNLQHGFNDWTLGQSRFRSINTKVSSISDQIRDISIKSAISMFGGVKY